MILECQKVQKEFLQGQNKIEVLKGVNLCVDQGETVAILGVSGSGKSTLLSILSGIESPDRGSILFSDADITNYSQEQLTKIRSTSIGVIFQQFHLIEHLNALENVMLSLEILGDKNALERAKSLLTKVGLEGRFNHFPSQLSGGERQRVAIARAIAINPKLLLADEPSGSLDEETGQKVMDLLFDLVETEKMALILVTHEKKLASRCQRTLHLESGILHSEK
ncbi:ABC transporter ATP-binding protein [Halobacteriovorax marinus]|uniref:ABC transporter ATP-binding protein n=1 Tax=Halobacteriovorax marinus TaxID=97084 RepID=A0A1Y5F885_9BACT|nr:ABC transporter ATP-binding protein [Halobacteriovorax marinus]